MAVEITLLDCKTGSTKIYLDTLENSANYEDSFMWSDGNNSCDCNRGKFLYNDEQTFHCFDYEFEGQRFKVIGWKKITHTFWMHPIFMPSMLNKYNRLVTGAWNRCGDKTSG